MKNWFVALEDNKKKNVIFLSWSATVLSFLLALVVIFFSYVFAGALVLSILFTKWDKKPSLGKTHKSLSSEETEEEKERKRRREEFLQRKQKEALEELESLPRYPITISTEKRNRKTGYEEPTFSNITAKGTYKEFVVFDTETTGLAPSKERIIEIAAIRFVDGVPTEIFESFVNPERPIPPEASVINHITDEMVTEAPTISQILPSFEAFVGKSPLVAHNLNFDLKFMYYSGSTLMDHPRKYFDTCKLAQKILKNPKYKYDEEFETWDRDYDSGYDVSNYKLETLAEYYHITNPNRHSAAADAIVTGKLFLKLINDKQTYWSSST